MSDLESAQAIAIDRGDKLIKANDELLRLRAQTQIQKAAIDRWVPCPDHRDNRAYDGCPVCRDERRGARGAVLVGLLKEVQQACLFDDDDGRVGVSEDVVISTNLFNRIGRALATLDVPDPKEQR